MAGSLNKVMIIGRLGRDPEVRYTQGGTAVANLRVATDETWNDRKTGEKQERTEWHTVVLWGRQAEIANEYLGKGRLIFVEGRLETRKWQDKQGQDRYSTEIRGLNFQMLDSNRDGGGGGGGRSGGSSSPPPHEDEDLGPAPSPDEDDIPF